MTAVWTEVAAVDAVAAEDSNRDDEEEDCGGGGRIWVVFKKFMGDKCGYRAGDE